MSQAKVKTRHGIPDNNIPLPAFTGAVLQDNTRPRGSMSIRGETLNTRKSEPEPEYRENSILCELTALNHDIQAVKSAMVNLHHSLMPVMVLYAADEALKQQEEPIRSDLSRRVFEARVEVLSLLRLIQATQNSLTLA